MSRSVLQLAADVRAIWQAGVDAVRSERLVQETVQVAGDSLLIGEDELDLRQVERIVVVGAGKAGAGMALGLEAALGESLATSHQLQGWINVPADCLQPTRWILLHPARPAGLNEPTAAGLLGTEKILELVAGLGPRDVCFCLLSGGGSALLPAPAVGLTLADKQQVTRALSAAGANIRQLNIVRKHLSRIKGGRLAAACKGGRLYTLIISDVLGDPLDLIASGPTVPDTSTPAEALSILEQFGARAAGVRREVFDFLQRQPNEMRLPTAAVTNLVIGNNAVAVDAAGLEAERRGYSHAMISASAPEGDVHDVAHHLVQMSQRMLAQRGPDCLISGGEPVVSLAHESVRGRGGRNQQLALAALQELGELDGLALLSGGTDGEDGPTPAAGAMIDAQIAAQAKQLGLDADDYLRRNDAYTFFAQAGGLLQTGPTHTNVCDLRVICVARQELS